MDNIDHTGMTALDYLAEIHEMLSEADERWIGNGVPYMHLSTATYHQINDTIEEALGKYVVGAVK